MASSTTFTLAANQAPYCQINSPENGSILRTGEVTLNVTCIDQDLDPLTIKIFGKKNSTANISANLIYRAVGESSGVTIPIIWGTPVVDSDDLGLKLLLHFNNRSEYGENDTLAYDFSGQGNNGTIGGSEVTLNTSSSYIFGGTIVFDGQSGNNVSIDPTAFDNLSTGTISMWFKYDQTPNQAGELFLPLLFYGPSSTTNGSGLILEVGHSVPTWHGGHENATELFFTISNGSASPHFCFDSLTNLTDNTWYNLVVVVNETGNTGYLNGVEMTGRRYNFGDENDSVFFSHLSGFGSNVFTVGAGKGALDNSWYHFNGTIDDLAIWNRSLSSEEVSALYSMTAGTHYVRVSVSDGTDESNVTHEFTLMDNLLGCNEVPTGENYTMLAGLTCNGTAIRLQSGMGTLDCAGLTISGNGSGYGIDVQGGSTIKNCVIQGFERGINVNATDFIQLINNTVRNNTHGIVVHISNLVNLTNNTVSNNSGHGVFFCNRSLGGNLSGNVMCGNNQFGGAFYDILINASPLDTIYPDTKWIEHIGIDLAPYNNTTQLAGGVVFDSRAYNRVYSEFARDGIGISFDYVLDPNANIYAIANGTVTEVAYNPSHSDYGLGIDCVDSYGRTYGCGVDHVVNVTVSEGDNVTAGQIIAKPGYLMDYTGPHDPIHDGQQFAQIEIGIGIGNYVFCPTRYYTDSLLAEFNESITRLISEWETFKGNENVHNESAFVLPGCLTLELPSYITTDPNSGANNTCGSAFGYNDADTSGCANACPAQAPMQTLLPAGWNLISIPLSL